MIDVSNSYVNQIEKGPLHSLSVTILAKIAEALDVSCDWLVFGKEAQSATIDDINIHSDLERELIALFRECNPLIQANLLNLLQNIVRTQKL